jgi:1-phosphofructokinase family hexose kinase
LIYTVTFNPGIDRTLVVPEITFLTVLRAEKVHLSCGGKGFNVSRVLRQLNTPSKLLGFLGGATGQQIQSILTDEGFETEFVEIEGETRNNIVIIESKSSNYIKINEPGPMVSSPEQEQLLETVTRSVKRDDYWVLSGSLPRGISGDYLIQLIKIIHTQGGKVFLDTSGLSLTMGVGTKPFLVKPNAHEASEVTGVDVKDLLSGKEAVGILFQQGIENVALTLGAEGLIFQNDLGMFHAIPPKITPRNPTGAGDSLMAGLLYGFLNSLPIESTLKWAVAAGTASATKDDVASATKDEIRSFFSQVEVNNISTDRK